MFRLALPSELSIDDRRGWGTMLSCGADASDNEVALFFDGSVSGAIEALADGEASVCEPAFANILAEINARIAPATATVETLDCQIGKSAKIVTSEMVEAFAALVGDRLRDNNPCVAPGRCGAACLRGRDLSRRDPHRRRDQNPRASDRQCRAGQHGHGAHV